MVHKKIPKMAKVRFISEDPKMVELLLSLVEEAPGVTPMESDADPQKGRGGKSWIGYQTILIDPVKLEALIEGYSEELRANTM